MHKKFRSENLKGTDHPANLGVRSRIILELIFGKKGEESVDCINLAQNRDQWRALVNTVMKLRVP
jgi:hypothetical protein